MESEGKNCECAAASKRGSRHLKHMSALWYIPLNNQQELRQAIINPLRHPRRRNPQNPSPLNPRNAHLKNPDASVSESSHSPESESESHSNPENSGLPSSSGSETPEKREDPEPKENPAPLRSLLEDTEIKIPDFLKNWKPGSSESPESLNWDSGCPGSPSTSGNRKSDFSTRKSDFSTPKSKVFGPADLSGLLAAPKRRGFGACVHSESFSHPSREAPSAAEFFARNREIRKICGSHRSLSRGRSRRCAGSHSFSHAQAQAEGRSHCARSLYEPTYAPPAPPAPGNCAYVVPVVQNLYYFPVARDSFPPPPPLVLPPFIVLPLPLQISTPHLLLYHLLPMEDNR
ncbi:uncharacterized protein [Bemisia tabaci]|uniref:uncharacterized protein n=1 Tax=Bemisia tabaci TaxID=7038 RepID=UPI003B27EE34